MTPDNIDMTYPRPDLSKNLIHLVKGENMECALDVLMTILEERRLKGGNGMIKGGHICVCFTESPLAQLTLSLARRERNNFKYRALGIMVIMLGPFQKMPGPLFINPRKNTICFLSLCNTDTFGTSPRIKWIHMGERMASESR
jgi:hypothetical protein